MCGGGGGGGVSERLAVQSANDEQARQARINEGMRQLEIMFNGGRRAAGQLGAGASYDPNATYYDKNGNAWNPDLAAYRKANGLNDDNSAYIAPYMENIGGGEGGEWVQRPGSGPVVGSAEADAAVRKRAFDEAVAGGNLFTGTSDVSGYGPDFYQKAYDAQLGYALPEVDRQFKEAQRNLTFALARQGLSSSSQASNLQSDLEHERQLAIQGEQDKANQVRAQQQSAVETERGELTRLLQSTGDVESTMNMANSRKSMLEAAPSLATVGPLFQNTTGALADMIVSPALRESRYGSGRGYGSSNAGSGKVVT